MQVFEFLKALFNPPPPSGATAKERLKLVLLSDQLSLAPDVIEALKRDLLEVISRYVEIDFSHADVTFEHRETEVAMLANVPITGVRERHYQTESRRIMPAEAPVAPAAAETSVAEPVAGEPVAEKPIVPEPIGEPADANEATPVPAAPRTAAATARRRRRKKSHAAGAAQRGPGQPPALGNPAQA